MTANVAKKYFLNFSSLYSCYRQSRSFLVLRLRVHHRSVLRHLLRAGDARQVPRGHREKDDGPGATNVFGRKSPADEFQHVTRCTTKHLHQPPNRHRFFKELKVESMIFRDGRSLFGDDAVDPFHRSSVALI